jgi:CheY-like chemotaxis protein
LGERFQQFLRITEWTADATVAAISLWEQSAWKEVMNDSGQTKKCLRVLHLEDDPFDADLIKTGLGEHNISCAITQVHTLSEFEAALQHGGIDLILSDSQLPSFDTMAALSLAQQKNPNVPFIFVSGTTSPSIKGEAFRRGAVDFINKDEIVKLARVIHWLFFMPKRRGHKPVLPEIGTPVMVQCKGFRCLGYLDRNGEWRDFGTSGRLNEVIDWSEL